MAAAVGIHFTANNPLINHRRESENTCLNHNAHVGPSSGSISRSINLDLSKRCRRGRMTMNISAAAEMGIAKKAAEPKDQKAAVVYEKMDEWMRDSVVDIVKNLREAPLLVHVYSNNNNKDSIKTTTEKTVEEQDWTDVIEKWKTREMPLPDGVIFVEQLIDNNEEEEEEEEESKKVKEEITRAWGIVVQGRGVDCGPICYLLKTSRVSGDGGFGGLCCATHFCLMRVKSFRECARSQLQKCWLSSSSSS